MDRSVQGRESCNRLSWKYRPTCQRLLFVFCFKEENDASPDLYLVTDVIDHIHSCGEPGKASIIFPTRAQRATTDIG